MQGHAKLVSQMAKHFHRMILAREEEDWTEFKWIHLAVTLFQPSHWVAGGEWRPASPDHDPDFNTTELRQVLSIVLTIRSRVLACLGADVLGLDLFNHTAELHWLDARLLGVLWEVNIVFFTEFFHTIDGVVKAPSNEAWPGQPQGERLSQDFRLMVASALATDATGEEVQRFAKGMNEVASLSGIRRSFEFVAVRVDKDGAVMFRDGTWVNYEGAKGCWAMFLEGDLERLARMSR
ncbi:hypothetical protein BJ508DRAFT_334036 [Ascobolus immersus RN42]|uniref:Uncharacterized protein n=1 Tax=Ascobolus immersus RN42 TaxID=1160509 RepID=A0A3N4HNQ7_ASCIM|nr:hypothetical protein BJ508DRAFT_334036 [Ascobolus immersus RN42]